MRYDQFSIGALKFSWGHKLSDITSQLRDTKIYENDNSYSHIQSIRVPIKSYLGQQMNSVVFKSPFQDRIINSIVFNFPLSSDESKGIVGALNKEFGDFSESGVAENYGTGSVTEHYTWKLSNCTLGVCIYGGARNEFGKLNRGCIWIRLKDIDLLSSLYSEELNLKSQSINTGVRILTKIRTGEPQRQSGHLEKQNYPDHSADFISVALNGYRKRNLLLTPKNLRNKLTDQDVCIFIPNSSNTKFIANKFECVELDDINTFRWIKTHPAKGSGNHWLTINDFHVVDSYDSKAIEKILRELGPIIDAEIEYIEDHDC